MSSIRTVVERDPDANARSLCGRPPALTEHGRDLVPAVQAPQANLTAGPEAEEQHERGFLGRQTALRLHAAAEFLVQPLDHVRRAQRLPLALGDWKTVSNSSPPSWRLRTAPGPRARHSHSKAVEAARAAAALSA